MGAPEIIERFFFYLEKEECDLFKRLSLNHLSVLNTTSTFQLCVHTSHSLEITLDELNRLQELWVEFVHFDVPKAEVHSLLVSGTVSRFASTRGEIGRR